MEQRLPQAARQRIELIDIARGLALVAMAIYHFTWDLDFFGYIEPGTSVTGGWKVFARSIASSFLFLVGFSLYLAHGEHIRVRAFLKRLAVIAVAAGAITAATYIAMPQSFIFFGILHHIAVASVLGLAFLRLPAAAILAAAALVIAAPHFVHASILDRPLFWWTGLSRNVPGSNDFIPVFPWFAAVLGGMAAARLASAAGLLARMAEFVRPRQVPLLPTIGRHSLSFYLLHQPILFSSVWLLAQLAPPPAPDQAALFERACTSQCAVEREESFCRAYCQCLLDEAVAQDRLDDLYNPTRDADAQAWLRDIAIGCSTAENE